MPYKPTFITFITTSFLYFNISHSFTTHHWHKSHRSNRSFSDHITKGPCVRFAPSPTGKLHIGSARTHLFNQLFSKTNGGKLILRIDDTDTKRCSKDFERDIIDSLGWLGLDWDEGPHRQSERLDLYREAANWLVSNNHAYLCYCTPEELDAKRDKARRYGIPYSYDRKCYSSRLNNFNNYGGKYSIRFKSNTGEISFMDHKGNVIIGQSEGDYIIMRSNGAPTYNFTCAVDDKMMGITHVIRSNDHYSNTHKQCEIIKKLNGFNGNYHDKLLYVHCPMILTPDSAKIGKRDHSEMYTISHFKQSGYLPQALLNYLATLGWHDNSLGEFFDVMQLHNFSLDNLTPSSACFSVNKLNWYNRSYAKRLTRNHIHKLFVDYLMQYFNTLSDQQLDKLTTFVLDVFGHSNFRYLYQQLVNSLSYELPTLEKVDPQLVDELISADLAKVVDDFSGWIGKLSNGDKEKKKCVLEGIRYLLTGNMTGIPVTKLLELLLMVDEWKLEGFVSLESRLQFLKTVNF
ncbi:glutamyl-tRNA synthetase [Babesia microti strain RI]|uniref:Glutamyl-tRNA synthetase n=1 Tax=Babesia microti (strain RI) TaxID=1133968 RepID=A0A1R4AC98_BABMR|nr:glutamyl-tRNA synthetase [Babesia microti strain RI]SJK86575.1 glutamyl-tRNA synthetase [Babesia microti strain RI]|eukprot:XP_021338716.1 glutamyl-tRNA synthetase [Babesia microti strain RI]